MGSEKTATQSPARTEATNSAPVADLVFADRTIPYTSNSSRHLFQVKIGDVTVSAPTDLILHQAVSRVRAILVYEHTPLTDADIANIREKVEGAIIERA